MKKICKLLLLLVLLVEISCQANKEKTSTMEPKKINKTLSSKTEDLAADKEVVKEENVFFTKYEIDLSNTNNIYNSNSNEVILFRPTEFDFGKMVEETQSDELLDLDGNFEELTNHIIDTFKGNKKLKITVCEKSYISVPNKKDTLYLDASKHLYGIVFNRKDQLPIFKEATEENIIAQIKNYFNL